MLLIINILKIRLGCDPGLKGGIAAIYEDGSIKIAVTPLIAGKEIDVAALKQIFLDFAGDGKNINGSADILVLIEDVHSIPLSSAKSNFNFGTSLGILTGVVAGLGLPYVKIQPKKWQELAFTGVPKMYESGSDSKIDTKKMALVAAKRLFPGTNFLASSRCSKEHDGMVDALMMAYYLKVKF